MTKLRATKCWLLVKTWMISAVMLASSCWWHVNHVLVLAWFAPHLLTCTISFLSDKQVRSSYDNGGVILSDFYWTEGRRTETHPRSYILPNYLHGKWFVLLLPMCQFLSWSPEGYGLGYLGDGVLPLNLDGVCRALLGTLTLTIFITLFQIWPYSGTSSVLWLLTPRKQ